jgi:hypothetical protein
MTGRSDLNLASISNSQNKNKGVRIPLINAK